MKVRRIIILVLVLLLIIGLEVFLMDRLSKRDTATASAPTAEPEMTQAPDAPAVPQAPVNTPYVPGVTSPPAPPTVTQGPEPTWAPEPTQAPTEPPTPPPTEPPTPLPTDPPPPSDVTTGSGSFSSDTGTALNLNVDWTAVDHGDGTATVSITGSVVSYDLDVGSTSVDISFGGYSASCGGNSLSVGSGGFTVSRLFSTSMTVASDTEGTMTVSWYYNGTYSEVSLPTITASGYVYT